MLFFAKVIAVLRFSKMKLSTVALLTASLVGASLPTAPRPVVAQSSCDLTIISIVNDINNRLGIPADGELRNGVLYDSPFVNRDKEVLIALYTNNNSPAILGRIRALDNSPQLRARYARRIFDACPRAAKVSFGFSHGQRYLRPPGQSLGVAEITSFVVLMPDGSVREGKCFPPPDARSPEPNLRWGEMQCAPC